MCAALTSSPVRRRVETVEAIKPPRLNFARVCLYCGERDCVAPRCIESYERSSWIVCAECDGQEWSEMLEPCGCTFGVVEGWHVLAIGG